MIYKKNLNVFDFQLDSQGNMHVSREGEYIDCIKVNVITKEDFIFKAREWIANN
jgi:hypothetical protein